MNFLPTRIPEPVRIEIAPDNGQKRAFTIGLLRQDTCLVLHGLFEHIGKEFLDLERARQTNYLHVERNRSIFCLIIAIAIRNYKADYSKRVRRFITRNTSAHELLALIYVVQRQVSLFIVWRYIDELDSHKMNALFQLENDKRLQMISGAMPEHNGQLEKTIQALNTVALQTATENNNPRIHITGTKKYESRLTITHGA